MQYPEAFYGYRIIVMDLKHLPGASRISLNTPDPSESENPSPDPNYTESQGSRVFLVPANVRQIPKTLNPQSGPRPIHLVAAEPSS